MVHLTCVLPDARWCRDISGELRPQLQAASQQVASLTSDTATEAAAMRTSYTQQISNLKAEVTSLQQALVDARAAQTLPQPPLQGSRTASRPTSADAAPLLAQRVEQLEAANAALERALLDAHSNRPSGTSAAAEVEMLLQNSRAALAERDAQVGSLKAELEILHTLQGHAKV